MSWIVTSSGNTRARFLARLSRDAGCPFERRPRIRPFRRRLDEGAQLLDCAPGIEPIADIAFGWKIRQRDNFDGQASCQVGVGDGVTMFYARRIVVRKDDDSCDSCLFELLGQIISPLARAPRIAGGNDAKGRQPIRVFLALRDEHNVSPSEFREPVEHPTHAFEIPQVPA